MDHSYDRMYYTDEDTQDTSVPVTELNTEADATFIDIVRGYPHIYAKNLKDFKDKNVRERSWVEIASVLNCSVEDCQRRWLRLRDRFAKERRLRDAETRSGSGSTTGRKEFSLYQNMMFLSEHIQSRKTFTNLQSVNRKQPVINAHAALSCISSSARTVQNHQPLIPLSPSLSPSSCESMPFSSVSTASSRNTPSPQIYTRQQSPIPKNIPLSRNSALLPIRNSTPSSSSHNFTNPVTSPQSILTPQSFSDFEETTNPEESSQENISTPKRKSQNMQQEQNNSFGGWTKKKDALTLLKQIF